MSQRISGYERKTLDSYETPAWVTEALLPHLPDEWIHEIWEPACGSGQMVRVLETICPVRATDIIKGDDFLTPSQWMMSEWIITNPPYDLAEEFIVQALAMADNVAMLLRTDYDHASSRQYLFGKCKSFAKKLVLTKRIKWFENSTGSPSFNHAWFIWSHAHKGPPTLVYGP